MNERIITMISHSTNDSIGTTSKPEKLEEDYLQKQFKWEEEHMGNFRRIYPCSDCEKYEPFFKQTNISVYQDTAASRAREEASRIQKEENEVFLHFHKIYLMNGLIIDLQEALIRLIGENKGTRK